jgi:hypothetical protein
MESCNSRPAIRSHIREFHQAAAMYAPHREQDANVARMADGIACLDILDFWCAGQTGKE